jgi:type IV secretory pathway TraG/TraD family ATPase VirD4
MSWLWFTGIWTYPLLAGFMYLAIPSIASDFGIPQIVQILLIYGFPLVMPITITWTNIERKQRGQTDFSFKAVYGGFTNKSEKLSKEYIARAYPDVNPKFCKKIPQGIAIGRHKGKYICCPLDKDATMCSIYGSPGSGKTTTMLSFLMGGLWQSELATKAKVDPARPYNFFLVDLKCELWKKLLFIEKESDYRAAEHPEFQVFQPSNRQSFGWDVFYRLKEENVTESEKIKLVSDLSDILIETKEEGDYFSANAKRLLQGIMLFYVYQNWEFIDIIQKITRSDLFELLSEIVPVAEQLELGVVLDKLKSFVGKEDNESIADIQSTMCQNLSIFSYPDIIYALRDNPYRTSPAVLTDGKTHLDFAIEDALLSPYRILFRMVVMQILQHAEAVFTETEDRRTLLILDEFARCGFIPDIQNSMALLRSKKTSIILITQNQAQLKNIYKEDLSQAMLDLCELKVFLSGTSDKDTSDLVSRLAGEYDITKLSYGRKGIMRSKSDEHYSSERRAIVEPSDLQTLRERNEAIIFLFGNYARVAKLQYFNDKLLTPLWKEKQAAAAAKLKHKAQAQVNEPTKKETE